MTIQPKRNSFTVHCDTCKKYVDVDTSILAVLERTIKFYNWKTYKDKSGKWSHKCPTCQEG